MTTKQEAEKLAAQEAKTLAKAEAADAAAAEQAHQDKLEAEAEAENQRIQAQEDARAAHWAEQEAKSKELYEDLEADPVQHAKRTRAKKESDEVARAKGQSPTLKQNHDLSDALDAAGTKEKTPEPKE